MRAHSAAGCGAWGGVRVGGWPERWQGGGMAWWQAGRAAAAQARVPAPPPLPPLPAPDIHPPFIHPGVLAASSPPSPTLPGSRRPRCRAAAAARRSTRGESARGCLPSGVQRAPPPLHGSGGWVQRCACRQVAPSRAPSTCTCTPPCPQIRREPEPGPVLHRPQHRQARAGGGVCHQRCLCGLAGHAGGPPHGALHVASQPARLLGRRPLRAEPQWSRCGPVQSRPTPGVKPHPPILPPTPTHPPPSRCRWTSCSATAPTSRWCTPRQPATSKAVPGAQGRAGPEGWCCGCAARGQAGPAVPATSKHGAHHALTGPRSPPSPTPPARRRTKSAYNAAAESTLVADIRPARLLTGAAGGDEGAERQEAEAEIERCSKVRRAGGRCRHCCRLRPSRCSAVRRGGCARSRLLPPF